MAEQLLGVLALSLSLTLLLETAFALAWGVRGRGLGTVVLMNVMTNPAAVTLHFLLTRLAGLGYWASAIPLELGVLAAEWACARGVIRRPLLYALCANTLSYTTGLLLQALAKGAF